MNALLFIVTSEQWHRTAEAAAADPLRRWKREEKDEERKKRERMFTLEIMTAQLKNLKTTLRFFMSSTRPNWMKRHHKIEHKGRTFCVWISAQFGTARRCLKAASFKFDITGFGGNQVLSQGLTTMHPLLPNSNIQRMPVICTQHQSRLQCLFLFYASSWTAMSRIGF